MRGGPEVLLDSYQSERHPHARAYVETAVRLGGLINTSGTAEALRDGFRQPDGSVKMESLARPLGPGLGIEGDSHRGWLAPQPRLSDGRLLDDHTDNQMVLIVDQGLLVPLTTVQTLGTSGEPALAEMLRALDTRAVLLRPDRHVFGTCLLYTSDAADE